MIQALKDFVIVRQKYAEESSGIIIPETANKHKLYDGKIKYIVESVGPDYPWRLRRGDMIEIVRHEGIKFVHEGVDYWKVKARWIEGVYV